VVPGLTERYKSSDRFPLTPQTCNKRPCYKHAHAQPYIICGKRTQKNHNRQRNQRQFRVQHKYAMREIICVRESCNLNKIERNENQERSPGEFVMQESVASYCDEPEESAEGHE